MNTLNEHEVAQVLRCSVACLRRMRREKRGPRWTRVGRLVRYPERWLNDYLEANSSSKAYVSRTIKTASAQ
jgi:Helix-turn-helix domain